MRPVRVLMAAALVALVFASVAGASDIYAGLSRSAAIETAKRQIIALGIAFNGLTPAKAAQVRRKLDGMTPRTFKSACKGIRAWKIVYPNGDPLYVNGLLREGGWPCLGAPRSSRAPANAA